MTLRAPERQPYRRDHAADHDHALGPAAVEPAPANLDARRETEEEDEQVQAGFLRAVAERDLRVDAREEEDRYEDDHRGEQDDVLHPECPDPEDPYVDERLRLP